MDLQLEPVSVSVCTRDRPADLRRCIASVLESEYPLFRLIVVDQGTNDAGAETVAAFADPRIDYVRDHRKGVARARNRAMELAQTPLLLFTDDDCTVTPGWIRRHVEVLDAHPHAACSFGALAPVQHDPEAMFAPAFAPSRFRVRTGKHSAITFSGCSANVAVRLAAASRLGGFDESLGAGSKFRSVEDVDLACRALRNNFAVIEDPCSVVAHWGFRPYHDGSVQRYMRDVFYAEGARQMRDLRSGELWAVPDAAYRVALQLETAMVCLVRDRRPTGAGRLAAYGRGLVDALRTPIDRRSGLFAGAANPRP